MQNKQLRVYIFVFKNKKWFATRIVYKNKRTINEFDNEKGSKKIEHDLTEWIILLLGELLDIFIWFQIFNIMKVYCLYINFVEPLYNSLIPNISASFFYA